MTLFKRDNLLAWCIVPFDAARRSPQQRAAMLQRLGIRALAYDWRDEHVSSFDEELRQLRDHGICLHAFWLAGGAPKDADAARADGSIRAALDFVERNDLQIEMWKTCGGRHLEEIADEQGEALQVAKLNVDEAGYGVSSDVLSHTVDLAHMLLGPITEVSGTRETFIRERPLPKAGGTHYDRGQPGDPTGEVTNEDYAAAMVRFANGARGTFESSRAIIGPESQMAFDVYGTKGALRWNLETMNEMQVFLVDEEGRAPRGYTTVYAGDRYPYHGHFVPGDANAIGYEDLKVIENFEFLTAVATGEQHRPGFSEAVEYVSFQSAWLRSCESGAWETVNSIRQD